MGCTSAMAQYAPDGCAHSTAASLPFTGFDLLWLLCIGLVLVAAGTALWKWARE